MRTHSLNKNKAFTLVEMIVSLAIFSIVATVALGALVSIVSANKKAQTLQSTITNLNFALESMSREMRVGGAFRCESNHVGSFVANNPLTPLDCSLDQNKFLAFESSRRILRNNNPNDTCFSIIAYKFEPNTVTTDTNDWILSRAEQESCDQDLGSDEFIPVISPEEVKITDFALQVTPDPYPVAFIMISGHTGVREREQTDFSVQTAVSPRLLPGN